MTTHVGAKLDQIVQLKDFSLWRKVLFKCLNPTLCKQHAAPHSYPVPAGSHSHKLFGIIMDTTIYPLLVADDTITQEAALSPNTVR